MQVTKIKLLIFAALLLVMCPVFSSGQTTELLTITADSFANEKNVELDKLPWKYQAGDDLAWAARDFDDSAWEQLPESRFSTQSLPASGWNGRAWFRLRLRIDESAANQTLALLGRQIGASEFYLDGKLLAKFGEIEDSGEREFNPNYLPVPFRFETAGEHVLAVRYSASAISNLQNGTGAWLAQGATVRLGPAFRIKDASNVVLTIHQYAEQNSRRVPFSFIGFLLAFAVLHLLLFIFYRAERANLFYSIFVFTFALSLYCGNLQTFGHEGITMRAVTSLLSFAMLATTFVALLAFFHVAFQHPVKIVFWVITANWTLAVVLSFIYLGNLGNLQWVSNIAMFLSITYGILLLVQALRKKRAGAWIVMGGMQVYAVGWMLILINQLDFAKLPPNLYMIGEIMVLFGVPVAVSIFLARGFASTNRNLQARLEEVKQLSAQQIEQERREAELRVENERRAKELQEARQLQLSLLPKKLPDLPNLEIAAYMKPATEVGGDYYDFHVGADQTLTVAVGDATGHGLRAGSVVTATKSLFNAFADECEIPRIFWQTSKALKKMNLRGLFMAMAMLKLKDNRLTISVAGMPPILIYRSATKQIEEIAIRAMPLGSVTNFEYQTEELALASGDTVVLMSDGFPERFNPAGEMLADDAAKSVLEETATESAEAIINRFIEIGEQWANGRPQDDDVTFVVLKVK